MTVSIWNFSNLGTDFYAEIVYTHANKAVTNNNGNVEIQNRNLFSNDRLWKFERQSDGTYIIISLADGKVLDVEDDIDADKINVMVHYRHGNNNQRWYIYQKDNNLFFRPANSNSRVLEVFGAETNDGSNVSIYEINFSDAQKFSISKIKEILI